MLELIPIIVLFAAVAAFVLSPIISLIIGFVRVSRYTDAKYSRAMNPDSYTDEDMKDLKKSIVISFVAAVVLAVVVIAAAVLFGDELTYM